VESTLLAVAGAHLLGEPLNPMLMALGAVYVRATRTAPVYRLVALPPIAGRHGLRGVPARPGLIRCAAGTASGRAVDVEVYRMPVNALGSLMVTVAAPLAIGTVSLADGTDVPGFVCESYAAADAPDISEYGGWRRYLASLTPA
jgi:allophanate hydrolase